MQAVAESERKKAARRESPLWYAAALAASVLTGLCLWWALTSHPAGQPATAVAPADSASEPQRHNALAPQPESPASGMSNSVALTGQEKPVEPSLREAFAGARTPGAALKLLQGAFKSAQDNARADGYQEMIALCAELSAHWPESEESMEARRMIAQCYEQMGDATQARAAFLAYADEAGGRAARRALSSGASDDVAVEEGAQIIADIIVAEAKRLFEAKDFTQSLSYGDILIGRYPQTEASRQAQCMVGEYCLRTRQPAQAAETFKAIIHEAPDSPAAKMAQTALPSALFNAGRQAEAVETWVEYSKHSADRNSQACGYYNGAVLAATRGSAYYPEALKMFAKVMQEYPDSVYAALSREAMDNLNAHFLDGAKILEM